MALELTDTNFQDKVLDSDKLTVVDFWAEWCGPCRMLAPTLDEVQHELGDTLKLVKMNIDENPHTPTKFGIRSIPTLILFKEGKSSGVLVGLNPKSKIVQWIKENI